MEIFMLLGLCWVRERAFCTSTQAYNSNKHIQQFLLHCLCFNGITFYGFKYLPRFDSITTVHIERSSLYQQIRYVQFSKSLWVLWGFTWANSEERVNLFNQFLLHPFWSLKVIKLGYKLMLANCFV